MTQPPNISDIFQILWNSPCHYLQCWPHLVLFLLLTVCDPERKLLWLVTDILLLWDWSLPSRFCQKLSVTWLVLGWKYFLMRTQSNSCNVHFITVSAIVFPLMWQNMRIVMFFKYMYFHLTVSTHFCSCRYDKANFIFTFFYLILARLSYLVPRLGKIIGRTSFRIIRIWYWKLNPVLVHHRFDNVFFFF